MPDPILIACAMEEEARPFLDALGEGGKEVPGPRGYRGTARVHKGTLNGTEAIVVTTGIGMTNAASALTMVLMEVRPRGVIFAGTTGGLGANVNLGDIVVGTQALYHDADASDFGYEPGQIPQMPALYKAKPRLVARAERALRARGMPFHAGQVSASNSFVSGSQVEPVRRAFPNVLAVDMETAAGAQVCWSFDVPWLSLRAVSDLCDPNAGEVFDASAPAAYERSYRAAMALVEALT